MFGGLEVSLGEAMFALVTDDVLYVKVDPSLAVRYAAAGSGALVCEKRGETAAMSFRRLPDSILDDSHEALDWAKASLAVAFAARRAR